MSDADVFTAPNGYTIVALVRGEKPIFYEELDYLDLDAKGLEAELATEGRCIYGGHWILVAEGPDTFSMYAGEFGCHDLVCQRRDPFCFELGSITLVDPLDKGPGSGPLKERLVPPATLTRQEATRFVRKHGYRPFASVPIETMRRMCDVETVTGLLIANVPSRWAGLLREEHVSEEIVIALTRAMARPPPE